METTKQIKLSIAHYQTGLEVVEAIKAIKQTIVGKVANKRVTDKITAAIVDSCNKYKDLGKFHISTDFEYSCINVHFYDYSNTFDVRISGHSKDLIVNGRLDGDGLDNALIESTGRFNQWIERANKQIAAMPEIIAFLESVVDKANKFDKDYKFYMSLFIEDYKITRFLEKEKSGN